MEQTREDVDRLVVEGFVPFRNKLTATFRDSHPSLFSAASAMLAGKDSRVGMQVTEGGRVAGEYTFHISGVDIVDTERGRLDAGVSLPLVGVIKPYVIIERGCLEKIVGDEAAVLADPFAATAKYLPDMTIRFLK